MSLDVTRILEFLRKNPVRAGYPLYPHHVVIVADTDEPFSIHPRDLVALVHECGTSADTITARQLLGIMGIVNPKAIYVVPDAPTHIADALERSDNNFRVLTESEVVSRLWLLVRGHLAYLDQT